MLQWGQWEDPAPPSQDSCHQHFSESELWTAGLSSGEVNVVSGRKSLKDARLGEKPPEAVGEADSLGGLCLR